MEANNHQPMSPWQNVINEVAIQSNSLCIAIFEIDSGKLLFANNAFLNLTKGDPARSLINPDFNKLVQHADPGVSTVQLIYEGLLTLGDDSSLNTTIQGRIFAENGQLLLTGEIDTQKLNQQYQVMAGLNREISNLQRQLTKEKFRLEQALEELKKANADLSILNAEKNRFLNMAAHDLRNPISTAISYADILIRDPDSFSEEQKEMFLKKMEERLQFAIQLMTELLDVSKIEAGTLDLNKQKHDLAELTTLTAEFNQLIANYKNITIDLYIQPGAYTFSFDRNKMEQVLNNIISNAIKYSPHGSKIHVHLLSHGDKATISVIDNGPGIRADELHLLFQPFQKTSNRPTAGESSTGLGLAISKKIIEQHGGKIQVESQPGKGSIFSVIIPAA